MNIFEQLKRSFAITKKDLSIYYMRGPVIIQGLLMPAFLFIAFSFKRDLALDFLIPGLLGMALFFAVSAITPVIAPWETRMKTLERLASSPISLWAIILGDIVASVFFGLFITFFILLVSVILLGIEIISLQLIIGIIISAFCFSALGTLISAPPADNPSNIMLFATLIKFPLIFISGVFVPIAEMGKFKLLSFFSPLTYFTDLARNSIQGASYFTSFVDLIILF
ncbi:ABC transporter permease, partial [Candidatus Woesearchaeota archaeon]|nr:ABC transporter permease [Candidatus Woesearchaeota archaeon]